MYAATHTIEDNSTLIIDSETGKQYSTAGDGIWKQLIIAQNTEMGFYWRTMDQDAAIIQTLDVLRAQAIVAAEANQQAG